ncbi:hypothetical protein HDU97_006556 [Phlyctochytrium planicorne]|nr:hypothetical protein HDU97_006556 [Phlyctochytrium planicorne]
MFLTRWTELLEAVIPSDTISRWEETIASKYEEPHRRYHTLAHIRHLLNLADSHRSSIPQHQFRILLLSILFHDIVYDPKRNDNEIESEKLFWEFWGDVVPYFPQETKGSFEGEAENAAKFILSTIKHIPHQSLSGEMRSICSLFLDLDMEILSQTEDLYTSYAEGIRFEYSHFPEKNFCSGRAGVLKGFLARPAIYYSEEFQRGNYEQAARMNIEREIAELESRANSVI